MSSHTYQVLKLILHTRPRTLIDLEDDLDKVIVDETVLISLRQICRDKDKCKGQLLEPKIKKQLMSVHINKFDFSLQGEPKCAHCGTPNAIPNLKIILGFQMRTFGTDKLQRHKQIDNVPFLSAIQLFEKTKRICRNSRDHLNPVAPSKLRNQHFKLFWNIIHYFLAHNLPYDLFLNYKDTTEIENIVKEFEDLNSFNCIEIDNDKKWS